jgi:4-diphosphocytidyl-2-C-methyl-D-erythritol kinase
MRLGPAYAKVNLALEVTGRRPDGHHDLRTVFMLIDWHDLVQIDLGADPDATGHSVEVTTAGPHAQTEMSAPDALVARAGRALLERAVPSPHALRITVHKRIPVAAGLGGGSADAAAVLRLAAAALSARGFRVPDAVLHQLAASLGSDLPALLAGGTSFGIGRGELLDALPTPAVDLAVAVAGASSTAAVYAALSDSERAGDGRALRVAEALRAGATVCEDDCGSALEAAATRVNPQLAEGLRRLRASTPGHRWHLTGSGGAAFALAGDALSATRLATAAIQAGCAARACRAVAAHLLAPVL